MKERKITHCQVLAQSGLLQEIIKMHNSIHSRQKVQLVRKGLVTTGSEQDYLLQGAGITEPAEATIRNYRNARSPPGSAGKKKLGDYSTERGASEANLAEPIMRNQRNTRPASGVTNRKNSIEKDQDGPSSDVQSDETTTPDPLPPGISNREDPTVQDPLPPGPLLGPTESQRKAE